MIVDADEDSNELSIAPSSDYWWKSALARGCGSVDPGHNVSKVDLACSTFLDCLI